MMCRRVSCKRCGGATYAGCGMHVEQVLAGVPEEGRCQCASKSSQDSGGGWRKWFGLGRN